MASVFHCTYWFVLGFLLGIFNSHNHIALNDGIVGNESEWMETDSVLFNQRNYPVIFPEGLGISMKDLTLDNLSAGLNSVSPKYQEVLLSGPAVSSFRIKHQRFTRSMQL